MRVGVPFALKVLHGRGLGDEQHVADGICQDPVDLLRHGTVESSQAHLDVGDGDLERVHAGRDLHEFRPGVAARDGRSIPCGRGAARRDFLKLMKSCRPAEWACHWGCGAIGSLAWEPSRPGRLRLGAGRSRP